MTQISNRIKILVVLMFLFSVFPFFNVSHAQTPTPPEQIRQYVPLAPLPGTTVNGSNRADLGSYIPGLFSLIIGLATVLAVARIIWGGVLYITTDAIQGKSQGKEMIIESIWGLVLISTCWLILYTINPRLTNLNLNIQPSVVPGTGGVTERTTTTMSTNEAGIRNVLALPQNNIQVNAGPCATGQTRGCTNLTGLPAYALSGLSNLRTACGSSCSLIITGGTEGGHATHGVGRGQVDMSPTSSLNNYLGVANPVNNTRVDRTIDGRNVRFTYEVAGGNSTGNHWHVSFE